MATITIKPIALNDTVETGSIDIALCGYGSYSPKGAGQGGSAGIIMDAEIKDLQATAANNTYEVELVGNDVIVPAGTYYTFTLKNDNGDILQISAYQFEDAGTYDLGNTAPIDPSGPPLPPPQPIRDELVIVDQDSPWFIGDDGTSFQMTLTHDVGGAAVSGITPGNLYTFIIIQDGVGGHIFEWPTGDLPSGIQNGSAINMKPNGQTIQTFVADSSTKLYPIAPATWYTP
jgi:hypothetical protein